MDLCIEGGRPLVGEVGVAADKSITHRALMLGALTPGTGTVAARGAGADNHSTARVLSGLGVRLEASAEGWLVEGVGPGGLRRPTSPLDCGNSGTTMRLVAGIVTGAGIDAELVGDVSLSRRPMGRVCRPLRELGGAIAGRADGLRELPPLRSERAAFAGGAVVLGVASAQAKSAVLLAGIASGRAVTVREPAPSRDHGERMLQAAGARITTRRHADGAWSVELPGDAALAARSWQVPGDFSSAAFLLAAGVLVAGSRVSVRDVSVNPTRTGMLDVLADYGARITLTDRREQAGEPAATLTAEPSVLCAARPGGVATVVSGAVIPLLIDELVVLAAVASQADGLTEVRDAGELRVKESDRVRETVRLLGAFGVVAEERPDGWAVRGRQRLTPAIVDVGGDHRLALTAAVLALAAPGSSVLRNFEVAAVSYPGFVATVEALGAKVRAA